MCDTKYIFIYGTLKKGFYNHDLLHGNANYITRAMTDEKYAMYPNLNNTFPFLIKSKKESYIFGELYEIVSTNGLDLLDELEGVPDLYIRDTIKVVILIEDKEHIVEAYVYFKNESTNLDFVDYSKSIDYWK